MADIAWRASQWWAALQEKDVAAETYAAWRDWHDACIEHQQAWQQLLQAGGVRGGGLIPSPVADTATVLVDDPAQDRLRWDRRQWLRGAAGVVAAGAGVWLARDLPIFQEWLADYRSATGEILALTLFDGSALVLNTASACSTRADAVQRTVTLIDGEIMLTVAPDPEREVHGEPRPLVVETPQGYVMADAGRFSAYRRDDGVVVRVFEGSVSVQPASAVSRVVLQAGEQLRFGRHGTGPVSRVAPNADAWVRGSLIVRELALGDFIAELARYRTGWLRCDEAVAGLPISGLYPVSDPERVLQALPQTLPVDIRRFTRYWTTVVPAGA